MDRTTRFALAGWILAALLGFPARGAEGPEGAKTSSFSFGRFGPLTVYQPVHPRHLVLFISGDGGWNLGVVGMARSLTELDATVVGIDIRAYEKAIAGASDDCTDAASDFAALASFVDRKLDLPRHTAPILVGYSSGATLVYAVLVQARPHTFLGALWPGWLCVV